MRSIYVQYNGHHEEPILFNLSNLGLIQVSGIDAAKFLQGQVTCNVMEVTDTESRMGAHCDHKGRVQFLFRIFKYGDNYYLSLPREIISHALSLVKKYAVFSKVKLEDVSEQWVNIGIINKAENYLTQNFSQLPEKNDQVNISKNKILIKVADDNELYLLLMPTSELSVTLENGDDIWQLKNIQAGIPQIDLQNTDDFTAHDLNLPELNAVSFNKGCYTGQEIVARMQHLGKLKQHLQVVEFSSAEVPLAKTKLSSEEGRTVGRLITVAKTGEHNYLALALLQDSAIENIICLENTADPIKVNIKVTS